MQEQMPALASMYLLAHSIMSSSTLAYLLNPFTLQTSVLSMVMHNQVRIVPKHHPREKQCLTHDTRPPGKTGEIIRVNQVN